MVVGEEVFFNLVVYGVDLRVREIHLVGKRGLERVEEIGGRFGGEYLFPELGILKPDRNVEIEIYVAGPRFLPDHLPRCRVRPSLRTPECWRSLGKA